MLAKNPSAQKQALIENTVLKVHYPMTPTVRWAKAKMSDQDFESLIAIPVGNISLVVHQVPQFYNYIPNNAYWVDFANAKTFGGGDFAQMETCKKSACLWSFLN